MEEHVLVAKDAAMMTGGHVVRTRFISRYLTQFLTMFVNLSGIYPCSLVPSFPPLALFPGSPTHKLHDQNLCISEWGGEPGNEATVPHLSLGCR